uniref:Uncharacterized protein n=1 Tax=Anguilla anguilla TaxID=7936 RepID=A0A0E9UIF3_ANGAN
MKLLSILEYIHFKVKPDSTTMKNSVL